MKKELLLKIIKLKRSFVVIIRLLIKFKILLTRLKLSIIIFIIKLKLSIYLNKKFKRRDFEFDILFFFIFTYINSLIIFKIIEIEKKILKNNAIFKTSNIAFQLEIEIIINNIELIFNVREFDIFKDLKNTLSISSRFSTINNIS